MLWTKNLIRNDQKKGYMVANPSVGQSRSQGETLRMKQWVTASRPCGGMTQPKDVLWLWLCVIACVHHHSGSLSEKPQRLRALTTYRCLTVTSSMWTCPLPVFAHLWSTSRSLTVSLSLTLCQSVNSWVTHEPESFQLQCLFVCVLLPV